ncbi:unnamed protein product [Owenia fusiformis]|uniref:Uncharacterized protein n=1 Tax=Owenia fusiformis TaxID=6347 RepID=A0A8J1TZK1_OWEFU|nr:unnamed protein product [Owenia fusiformis]
MQHEVEKSVNNHMNTINMAALGAQKQQKANLADYGEGMEEDDYTSEIQDDSKKGGNKQNHSEIEKRRRDKMNGYITELSNMIPMCNAMDRKLDKLTVLRMAVQHMKSIRGAISPFTEVSQKPAFLSDDELQHLILKAAEGFLFVVSCDRGKFLYASESVKNILYYNQTDLIGQSLFDIIHPKDISTIKEQLTSSDVSPRDRFIDAKTMMPVKTEVPQDQSRLCSGARRSFICRMRCAAKESSLVKTESEPDLDNDIATKRRKDRKTYVAIHCTGYLKSWPPAKRNLVVDNEYDNDCNLSCLVAVGQLQQQYDPQAWSENPRIKTRPVEFMSRHAVDGKFMYVDQRATTMTGYLPQELLGTSVYEHYHNDDLVHLADFHKRVLLNKDQKLETNTYRFKTKSGTFLHLKTKAFSFRNPWTKEHEFISAINTMVPIQEVTCSSSGLIDSPLLPIPDEDRDIDCQAKNQQNPETVLSKKYVIHFPDLMGSMKPGAGKIGRNIADEVLEMQHVNTKEDAQSAHSKLWHMYKSEARKMHIAQWAMKTSRHGNQEYRGMPQPTYSTSGNESSASTVIHGTDREPDNGLVTTTQNGFTNITMSSPVSVDASNASNVAETDEALSGFSEGNDEAAMAVIMSLLEADAGLGGPVDFNDLPWPL